jgi:hypothetical protein
LDSAFEQPNTPAKLAAVDAVRVRKLLDLGSNTCVH